jgi:sorbitol/mannitol transport system substrate-binding protein
MRGKPGWGDLFAPLTTVVQTFGGNWYDASWNATVDTPEWKEAVTFYKTLLDDSGEKDPVSFSFNECLTALKEGQAAMWADASVAASILEADDSPVKGKMGYAHMPVVKTQESGWLWSWNLAIPSSTKNQDAAVNFVKWATSKDYHKLVGEKLGWSLVPPGARQSTYDLPEYKEAAAAYAPITLEVAPGNGASSRGSRCRTCACMPRSPSCWARSSSSRCSIPSPSSPRAPAAPRRWRTCCTSGPSSASTSVRPPPTAS